METERGRIAVGWLIVEDLAMVIALVLLPALAGMLGVHSDALVADPLASYLGLGLWGVLVLTFVKVGVFVGFMLVVGRRLIPWILHYIAHTGSRELFRLAVLAIALTVAFGAAKLFGVSLALGAFFAGMILSEFRSASAPPRNRCRCATPLPSVFRLRRHAVRSREPAARTVAVARHALHHHRRKIGGRVPDRARLFATRSERH